MKKYSYIVFLLLCATAVRAQDLSAFRVNYDMAIPTGQFMDDFITKTSWRGISFEGRWALNDNVTAGLAIGWQVFAQQFDNITEEFGSTTTVNGTQFRFVNTLPILATSHYYFGEEYGIRPWVGLGIGTAFSDQRTQVGFFEIKDTSWSFALVPQLGVDVPLNSDELSFTFNVRYNYFSQNVVPFDYSFLMLSAGLKFPFY